jgi:hypothetical protein
MYIYTYIRWHNNRVYLIGTLDFTEYHTGGKIFKNSKNEKPINKYCERTNLPFAVFLSDSKTLIHNLLQNFPLQNDLPEKN